MPILQNTLHWYQHFFSEVIDLEITYPQEEQSAVSIFNVSNLELKLNSCLVTKSIIPIRIEFDCSQYGQTPTTTKEIAQKIELFLYKIRNDSLTKDVSFFFHTKAGLEKLVLKDPSGHEWLWY